MPTVRIFPARPGNSVSLGIVDPERVYVDSGGAAGGSMTLAQGADQIDSHQVQGFNFWPNIPEGAVITAVRALIALSSSSTETLQASTIQSRIAYGTTWGPLVVTAFADTVSYGTVAHSHTSDRVWTRGHLREEFIWLEWFFVTDPANIAVITWAADFYAIEVDYTAPAAQTWPALPETPTPEATATFTSQAAGTFALVDTPLPLQQFDAAAAAWPTQTYWSPAEMAFTGGGAATQTITLTAGIASAEAFGTAKVNRTVSPPSIASTEVFGVARLNRTITVAGIASAEVFGTAHITRTIAASSIATAQAFGVAVVSQVSTLLPTGIASGEALGVPSIEKRSIGKRRPRRWYTVERGPLPLDAEVFVSGIPSAFSSGVPALRVSDDEFVVGLDDDSLVLGT